MWHQAWPHNDLRLLKNKTLKLRFCKVHLICILFALKMLKTSNFDVTLLVKNEWQKNKNKVTSSMASQWPLLFKTKVKLLHHTFLWPPLTGHNKALDKGKIEAMATKFSKMFAINMLKKHRKFSRRGFTHLDATPIFKKSSRYIMRHPVNQGNLFRFSWLDIHCTLDTGQYF